VSGFCFVSRGKFLESLWTAEETLRLRAIVFLAPVSGRFEFGDQRCIASRTFTLRYTVLDAPPATMTVIHVRSGRCFCATIRRCFAVASTQSNRAHSEQSNHSECQAACSSNQTHVNLHRLCRNKGLDCRSLSLVRSFRRYVQIPFVRDLGFSRGNRLETMSIIVSTIFVVASTRKIKDYVQDSQNK